jgi:glycerophosphoryl diester phosphodiesterase
LELLENLGQALVDFILTIIPRKTPHINAINNCKVVAHRGAHNNVDVLENTLEAFSKAQDYGVYGIEFDIRWTKDFIPVVHHDKSLERVFQNKHELNSLTFKELRNMHPLIPALSEVIERFGKSLHLFIEIKEEETLDLEQQKNTLKQLLSTLEPIKDFHFLSLTEKNYHNYHGHPSGVYIMVATTNTKEISETVIKNDFAGITGHYLLLNRAIQLKHQGLNQQIGTGFPKGKNSLKREISRGVDWVFTNYPEKIQKILEDLKGRK